jgi:FAD/FMN-containing dehydrogenase
MSAPALDSLAPKLRGTLERPGTPAYEAARAVWNAMIDRRPAAIARCIGTADVQACVRFAREAGMPLSIKGGGHNIAGLAVCDGGLTLDMSPMRGVWVDRERRIARAQAGCLLGDVDVETQLHGLAAVLGFVSATGIAGLTLGGGFGYLTRRFGWTTDNVLGMDLVTASGELARASAEENPELFWALCGGGGNFGVVTGFDYRLHPVGPEIVGGPIAWRAEDAPAVLEMFRGVAEAAPPELTCVLVLRMAPPAPWLPPEVHGKPVLVLMACHSGPLEEATQAVAPIKAFGKPVGDVLQRRPYANLQTLLDATQPKGRRYYWKSEYLPSLEPAVLEGALAHFARMPSPLSAIVLFPVGGAVQHLASDQNATGNRDAHWVLNITAQWESAGDDEANVAWARSTWGDLRRFSTGGTYVNFLTAEEGDERIRAAYGANFDRLAAVKARWDPDNVFRVNKNIAPRAVPA